MTAPSLEQQLIALGNPQIAAHSQRFFKTGEGEYGAGDQFLGIRVPQLRQWVASQKQLALSQVEPLLRSPWHEVRLAALLWLVKAYSRAQAPQQQAILVCYQQHLDYVNNWDLVDSSAPYLLGPACLTQGTEVLYQLSESSNMWHRRVALLASFAFIRAQRFELTLDLAQRSLSESHDLMHKAAGWMLREVGKRQRDVLDDFIIAHYPRMPRTMLRYAIEHYPHDVRKAILQGQLRVLQVTD